MGNSFNVRWSQNLENIEERVLPWERQNLPPIPKNPTEEQLVEFLDAARPLIDRGRWWYLCMTPARFIKNVLSNTIVKVLLIVVLMLQGIFYVYTEVVLVLMDSAMEHFVDNLAEEQFPELYDIKHHFEERRERSKTFMAEASDPELKALAEERWPDSFTMQRYAYEKQEQSKAFMAEASDPELKALAEERWSDDYNMQQYHYKRQKSAKTFMDNQPESFKKESAQQRWPNDYTMQKYIFKSD